MEDKTAQQNIYDDEIFFEGYKKIRDNKINANNLFEIPTLFSMLPDLKNKRILDLGCGFGEHCKRFIECGAKRVVGIDISEKMLEVARNENSDPNIIYINMPMEKIAELKAATPIIGLVLLLLVLVVAMIAVPVIAVIAILYNSPFALFLPPLESGDTVQTVTSAYVQEFNRDVNMKVNEHTGYDLGELVYVDYEGMEENPSNYYDIMAV